MERIGDLEIDQHLGLQKRAWRIERAGWLVMALIIVLALLGVFSTGPVSSTTAGNIDDGLEVQHQRFVRNDGEGSLTVRVNPNQIANGQVELWIAADYIDHVALEQITPEPDEVRTDGQRQIFVFLAEDASAPITLHFSFQPQIIGSARGDVGIVDGPSVTIRQFGYP